MPANTAARCVLNVVPIEIDKGATLKVGLLPYTDERLEQLRDEYRGRYFFKLDRQRNRIACVDLHGTDPLGDEILELPCGKNPWLVAPLVLESLLKFFHENRRPVLGYKPLKIVTRQRSDDLLRRKPMPEDTLPDWLQRRISFAFDTRTIYPDFENPEIGLACDLRLTNIIDAPVSRIIAFGVNVIGAYVEAREIGGDQRLWPKLKLLGRVREVIRDQNGKLKLIFDDHGGVPEADADKVFLEPRQEHVDNCVRSIAGEHASEILSYAASAAAELQRGSEQAKRTSQLFDHLRSRDLCLAPGIRFDIGPVLEQGQGRWYPIAGMIEKPTLVFDPSGSRTHTWNQGGLDKHGPYDRRTFSPKVLRIAVVCQSTRQGKVEEWVAKFLEGTPDVKDWKDRSPYEKGFVRRFHLQHAKTETFVAQGRDAAAYNEACRKALTVATDRGQPWHLALVQTEDSFHLLPGRDNPYLTTRSTFLKRGVPVQGVTIEKILESPVELGYIMNFISLACYAKLGGVPWLLKAQPTVARELVIGLGSHVARESRFGANERLVGITTVFSADGNYLLDTRTVAVPYAEYAEAMLQSVTQAVTTIQREQGWKSSDAVRLVFHAFKPFRDEEVQTIARIVGSLGHTNVQFAFLHFAESHPYRLFDKNQKGVAGKGGTKGIWAPPRGLFLELNRHEALVTFTGPNEVNRPSDGTPQPVLLKLHHASTFTDLRSLIEQAFSFSCHSWRTFRLARLPITILYSELIAKKMRELGTVPGWDIEALSLDEIGRRPWFL